MSRYMLAFDYPGEESACQACDDLEGVRRELVGEVADDNEQADAIIADMLRDGFWRDEGGRILLYQLCGTHGVDLPDGAQR